MRAKKEPELLPDKEIIVWIPRKRWYRHLRSHEYLSVNETKRLHCKIKEIEAAINKLRHAQSIAEKISQKALDQRVL